MTRALPNYGDELAVPASEVEAAPDIVNAIATVEGGGLDAEEVVVLFSRLKALSEAAKQTVSQMKKAMVSWIGINGEFEVGGVRYYAAPDKKVKARKDPADFYHTLMTALGGDEDAMKGCLASDAFKHGAVRSALEEAGRSEVYAELFETVTDSKLAEGKPIKSLQVTEARFLK